MQVDLQGGFEHAMIRCLWCHLLGYCQPLLNNVLSEPSGCPAALQDSWLMMQEYQAGRQGLIWGCMGTTQSTVSQSTRGREHSQHQKSLHQSGNAVEAKRRELLPRIRAHSPLESCASQLAKKRVEHVRQELSLKCTPADAHAVHTGVAVEVEDHSTGVM
jgi:hypothetical protein